MLAATAQANDLADQCGDEITNTTRKNLLLGSHHSDFRRRLCMYIQSTPRTKALAVGCPTGLTSFAR